MAMMIGFILAIILGLILIPIISRSLMGYLLISKESMKGSSLGAFFKRGTGDVDKVILLTSLLISSLILIFIFGIYGLIISLGMNLISLYFVQFEHFFYIRLLDTKLVDFLNCNRFLNPFQKPNIALTVPTSF